MEIEKIYNSIEIFIIFFITLIGIIGNCLNLKVFSSKHMKKITTFRYFFHLALVDIILLIFLFGYKLLTSRFFIISEYYSKIIFKTMTFSFNFLSQMNICIFTAANVNKARLVMNESKKQKTNKQKRLHTKIIGLICFVLFILNLNYLVFFDFTFISNHSIIAKDVDEFKNRTHHFVYQYITKPERNFTQYQIDLIINKTSLLKFDQIADFDLFNFHFINYYHNMFLYKIWFSIRLILFNLMPILINLTCTFIILRYNQSLPNKKRKAFNNQFVLLFLISNIMFIFNRLIKTWSTIYYKMNEYQLETSLLQFILQIMLNFKYASSFFIYLLTLRIYRNEILSLFSKKSSNNENIQLNLIVSSNHLNKPTIIFESNANEMPISQYLDVENEYSKRLPKYDTNLLRPRSKSFDSTWIGSPFFKVNSQF